MNIRDFFDLIEKKAIITLEDDIQLDSNKISVLKKLYADKEPVYWDVKKDSDINTYRGSKIKKIPCKPEYETFISQTRLLTEGIVAEIAEKKLLPEKKDYIQKVWNNLYDKLSDPDASEDVVLPYFEKGKAYLETIFYNLKVNSNKDSVKAMVSNLHVEGILDRDKIPALAIKDTAQTEKIPIALAVNSNEQKECNNKTSTVVEEKQKEEKVDLPKPFEESIGFYFIGGAGGTRMRLKLNELREFNANVLKLICEFVHYNHPNWKSFEEIQEATESICGNGNPHIYVKVRITEKSSNCIRPEDILSVHPGVHYKWKAYAGKSTTPAQEIAMQREFIKGYENPFIKAKQQLAQQKEAFILGLNKKKHLETKSTDHPLETFAADTIYDRNNLSQIFSFLAPPRIEWTAGMRAFYAITSDFSLEELKNPTSTTITALAQLVNTKKLTPYLSIDSAITGVTVKRELAKTVGFIAVDFQTILEPKHIAKIYYNHHREDVKKYGVPHPFINPSYEAPRPLKKNKKGNCLIS